MPSAAFCICGQARGFTNAAVVPSIRRNAIQAFGVDDSDVFLVLKYESEEHAHQIRAAATMLDPKDMLMRSSASDSSTVAHNTTKCAAPVNGTYMQRFMYAWHDIARCFEMVRREEANRGSAYDFVIKMRPDAQLCKPFPAWTALNLSNHKTEAHSMDKYSRTIATYGKVAADAGGAITLRSWPALWPTDISPQSKKLQIVRRAANMVAPASISSSGGVRRVTSQRMPSLALAATEGLLGTRTTIPSWACRIIAFGTRIKFFTVAQVWPRSCRLAQSAAAG